MVSKKTWEQGCVKSVILVKLENMTENLSLFVKRLLPKKNIARTVNDNLTDFNFYRRIGRYPLVLNRLGVESSMVFIN